MPIQDYTTRIEIPISRAELSDTFPDTLDERRTTIFIDRAPHITLKNTNEDTKKLLDLLKRQFPARFSSVENTVTIRDNHYARIGDRYYWIGENSDGAHIRIQSYDEDSHIKKVEEVKAELLAKGIIISSGECYVTIKELC
jgi:hypothetical protein